MTADSHGDVNSYAYNLAEILVSLTDAQILVVCTGENNKNIKQNANTDVIKTVFSNVSLDWNGNFEDYITRITEFKSFIKKCIKDFNPGIVHLNHYIDVDIDRPIVLTAHDDVLNKIKWTKRKGRAYLLDSHLLKYRDFIKENINKADSIVTLSRFTAQNLLRTYDVKNKIKIIYNGINSTVRAKENENISLFTSVNTKKETGNFGMFLKTVQKLPENINISVVENGLEDKKLSERINYHSFSDIEALNEICSSADIYLDLSNWETFGTVPMIAAFSKCAILANDIPFLREMWGDCGCIFERNNIYSLLRNLNNLIENRQYLNMVSQKCYNKAISVFNSKRMGYEYINLYKKFI
ncbi:MAG: glycosyltransferase [Candidatus Gastranaerophilaceae bacterium]|jgi:glycosyltransferase involved in cell wall biosynthesis